MPKLRPSDVPARIAAWPRAARILVPLACGALVALGHEAWMDGIWPVLVGLTFAFVAFPQPRRFAMFFGWLMGVGYFGVTLRWIIEPFLVDIARHGWMAPFAILLMAGGMA
ncbi:MAG: apolipoprotein N-acyltransferase, partial [Octadecabacter sp.]